MTARNLRMAAALVLPVIAAVLVPAGIAGCDDDKRRHDRVIVVPEERRHDRVIIRDRDQHRDDRHDRREHRDRD